MKYHQKLFSLQDYFIKGNRHRMILEIMKQTYYFVTSNENTSLKINIPYIQFASSLILHILISVILFNTFKLEIFIDYYHK